MIPTAKQIQQVSEVLALVVENFNHDPEFRAGSPPGEPREVVSDEAVAAELARTLAAGTGETELESLILGASALLRLSLEVA
jgi:hypothetical protein